MVNKKYLFFILIFFISSCTRYYLHNDSVYYNFKPIQDKTVVTSDELKEKGFEVSFYQNYSKEGVIQYITEDKINLIIEAFNGKGVLIFYNPNCVSIDMAIDILNYLYENKIPALLVSFIYSPAKIKYWLSIHNVANLNMYIVPSRFSKERNVLKKKRDFIAKTCANCYERYKDSVIFAEVMILSKDGNKIMPIKFGSATVVEQVFDWLSNEFDVK